MGLMETVGQRLRQHGGVGTAAVRQDPPDVPGVVFGRMRHSRVGSALRAHPVLIDSTLALAICVFALVPLSLSSRSRWVAVLLLTFAAAAPVCLRRRYPLGTFVTCALVSFAQILLWVPSLGTFSSMLIEFYTVAKWCSRRPTTAAAAAVTAWIVGFCVRLPEVVRPIDRVGIAFVFLPAAVAAGVLGVNANTRRAYVASITDRANRAERERDQQAQLAAAGERSRIAREMHDIVAHNLSVMIALADGASYTLRDLLPPTPDPATVPATRTAPPGERPAAPGPEQGDERVRRAAKAVESVSATGREALTQMRSLLGVLRDEDRLTQPAASPTDALDPRPRAGTSVQHGGISTPDDEGDLGAQSRSAGPNGFDGVMGQEEASMAPQPRIADLDRLIEQVRHAGPTVGFLVTGQRRALPVATELSVYRIVQESLTNVLKHAGPRASAVVRLAFDATGVDIEITNAYPDSARDPAHSPLPRSAGRGIAGMRERAALHGGSLVASPEADGWRVAARITAPAEPPSSPDLAAELRASTDYPPATAPAGGSLGGVGRP